uniref:NADH dehydrogenase subunit 4L n=1 Tax=Vargula tsujii TaxID=335805 RepID=A0A345WJY2_9CRUS|nr:NADH dehydrogenase subunit 4L [Vargula tsujii]AXJ93388.1 NADH dehydrogenase subunit 4L [Vargula tsujii]
MIFSSLDFVSSVFVVGIFSAFSSFLLDKHLLGLLMSLELMLMMLFGLLLLSGEIYLSLIYLTMGVCEGAVGLSLLVVVSRSHSGGFLASYSLSRC